MVAGPSVAQDCNPEPTVWGLCARRYAFGLVGQWLSQRHPIWSPLPPLPLSNTLRAFRQQAQRGIALNFDWPFPGITNDALSMSCVEQFVFANDGFSRKGFCMTYPHIELIPVTSLRPYDRNARTHSKKQIRQIASSIERFGFTNPVLISDDGQIIAGHGRVEAAKLLKIERVPALRLSHLNEAERRAYILADNKLAQNAGWDRELLALELQGLIDLDFDVELTGFSLAEAEIVLDEAKDSALDGSDPAAEDTIPVYEGDGSSVSRPGDLWTLGRHRLICGDARDTDAYERLLGKEVAGLIFTDPPYNLPIDGHVCGSGRIRHRDFAMGVGEMDRGSFTRFLVATLAPAAARCRDGAIAFICMDWRHMGELLAAGKQVFSELKNL